MFSDVITPSRPPSPSVPTAVSVLWLVAWATRELGLPGLSGQRKVWGNAFAKGSAWALQGVK